MPELPAIRRFVSDTQVRIYRIPYTFLPGLSGRVYLLVGAGPPSLVDAGSGQPGATRDILAGLDAVRSEFREKVRLKDIRRFLVTHGHFDHVGGLWRLVRRTDAQVVAHALDCRRVSAAEERGELADKALRSFLHQAGVPPEQHEDIVEAQRAPRRHVRSVPVDVLVEDGQQLDGLRFIHTPGHSPGHLCIRVGNILLSGDHVLPKTVPQTWPESMAPYTGLGHYLEALDKLQRVEGIELALGGHEPPMRNLYQRIDDIRASHLRKLQRLTDILRKAPKPLSIAEMTAEMYSQQKGLYVMLALTDVGSRVEYLDQRGRLAIANFDEVKREERPVCRYRPV